MGGDNIKLQEPTLPKGGSGYNGISDSVQMDYFKGTADVRFSIPVSRARALTPGLVLEYDASLGNSIFGRGFQITIPAVTRKTTKNIPLYDDAEDIFTIAGLGELTCVLHTTEGGRETTYYRPRVEREFADIRYEKENGHAWWQVTTQDNTVYFYGLHKETQIYMPGNEGKIYQWLLEEVRDAKDNRMLYTYKALSSNKYPHSIKYGNYYQDTGTLDKAKPEYLFEVVFDYGELDIRDEILASGKASPYVPQRESPLREDFFSSFRSGFGICTELLCRNICMFHHLWKEPPVLVKAVHFTYEEGPVRLTSIQESGYKKRIDGSYECMHMPPSTLTYTGFNPCEAAFSRLNLETGGGIPGYIGNTGFFPADLYGEGIKGLLYTSGQEVMYCQPLGQSKFTKPCRLEAFPIDRNLRHTELTLLSLDGNGSLDLVVRDRFRSGYYTLDEQNQWQPYVSFPQYPSDAGNPMLEYTDIIGDGQSHMLLCTKDSIRYYRALQRDGCTPAAFAAIPEDFPRRTGMDMQEYVGFHSMFGDGLNHRVRVRRDSVECWPNLGYGHFGEKILFRNPPCFPKDFSTGRLTFADVDGTGTSDLVYMEKDFMTVYLNQGNNSFGNGIRIPLPQSFTETDMVQAMDFLGNGTDAILHTKAGKNLVHYICSLLPSGRPWLLESISNNMGCITRLEYKSSVEYYLRDKQEGTPWRHKLPFPVSVLASMETRDMISGWCSVKTYCYRDGFYDEEKREFAGFGYVEEWERETTAVPEYKIPEVCTKMWFCTGKSGTAGGTYEKDESICPPATDIFDHEPGNESYSALTGCLRRKEVFIREAGAESLRSLSWYSYLICRLYPGTEGQKDVLRVTKSQTMNSDYYNTTDDPGVTHILVLEEDGYGHITKQATVSYPRRSSTAEKLQQSLAVSLEITDFINVTKNIVITGLSYQSRTFEISGAVPGLVQGNFKYFTLEQMKSQTSQALKHVLEYEAAFTGGCEARMVSWEKAFFWDDGQEKAMPLGHTGSRMLEHHKEYALYPKDLAQKLYLGYFPGRDALDTFLQEEAGLTEKEGYWWSHGTIHHYRREEEHMFFLPFAEEDGGTAAYQFTGRRREVDYDGYCAGAVNYRIWVNEGRYLETSAEMDYVSLQYQRVTDANGNVSQAVYDSLGMPSAISSYGKTEGTEEGGMDLGGYMVKHPLSYREVLHNGRDYLQGAMKYCYYDWFRFLKHGEPICMVELERTDSEHFCTTHSFRDGMGREVESKVKEGQQFRISGYVVNDSKGNPIRQYPPWFSREEAFEEPGGQEEAVPVAIYYDELGQMTRTEQYACNPCENGKLRRFFSQIVRTPWEERIYDYNDTLNASEFYLAFHKNYPENPTREMEDMKDALDKADAFWQTPLVKLLDNRGNVLHEVNYDGTRTTNTYDTAGRLRTCRDARIHTDNFIYIPDMSGQPLLTDGVDCGRKVHIYNRYGQICASWDGKALPVRIEYDRAGRSTAILIGQGKERFCTVQKTVYGDVLSLPDEEIREKNLFGEVYCYYDGSGTHTNLCFNIYGGIRRKETQFCRDYRKTPDWSREGDEMLEELVWTEETAFNDRNMPIWRRTADDTLTCWTYDEAGRPQNISVETRQGRQEIISKIAYNAKGMRTKVDYGNSSSTSFRYDPASHRLVGFLSRRQGNRVFQDVSCMYDPMGNLTRERDNTQDTVWHGQQMAEPLKCLAYDAYYRLIRVSGRELHSENSNDRQRFERYEEEYTYDNSGNLIKLRHTAPSLKFTRTMQPAGDSNRIKSMAEGKDRWQYSYDDNGNMCSMPHVKSLSWDYYNHLVETVAVERQDSGEDNDGEYYVYDGNGTRVRKVVKRKISAGITETEEWIYLGDFQSKKIYRNEELIFDRRLLCIGADGHTEALLYYWNKDDLKKETDDINRESIVYVYRDITDSAAIELDGDGALITREEYYPYGGTAVMTGRSQREAEMKQYRYRGRERDSMTGLYCFGVRYYAPLMGRWISADPAGTVDGLNLYQYARNNPTVYEDTDGRAAIRRVGGGGNGGKSKLQTTPPLPEKERDPRERNTHLRPRIGVLYRSDGRGESHYLDLAAVRQANPGAEVVTLVSTKIALPVSFKPIPPSHQNDLTDINAVFVPGGPAAHPDQEGMTSHSMTATMSHEQMRHTFEKGILREALHRNIPILAVCGGSWRLGRLLGARIEALPYESRRLHNQPMNMVNEPVHNVTVRGGTLLRRVLSGRYSILEQAPPDEGVLPYVNSSHWASSVFEAGAEAETVATAASGSSSASSSSVSSTSSGTTEAYAAPGYHFVLGVQWHPEFSPFLSQHANARIMYALGFAALENRAATVIQRTFREYRARRQAAAAVTIQRAFRAYQARYKAANTAAGK